MSIAYDEISAFANAEFHCNFQDRAVSATWYWGDKIVPLICAHICESFSFLGIEWNKSRNLQNACMIFPSKNCVTVCVICADEDMMIACPICQILKLSTTKKWD